MARSRKEILEETTAFRQWSQRGFHLIMPFCPICLKISNKQVEMKKEFDKLSCPECDSSVFFER